MLAIVCMTVGAIYWPVLVDVLEVLQIAHVGWLSFIYVVMLAQLLHAL